MQEGVKVGEVKGNWIVNDLEAHGEEPGLDPESNGIH